MARSALALQVLLEEGDPRFLDALLDTTEAAALKGLAERWSGDPRPEARRMMLAYVDDGLLRRNHPPLAKRLFKRAEAARDHEAMAHFMVAFDRMARRRLVRRARYDWSARAYRQWQALQPEPGIPRTSPTRKMKPVGGRCPTPQPIRRTNPYSGQTQTIERTHLETFTFRTRRYLARRAWRYFRQLGATDPDAYRDAIVVALSVYEDAHLTGATELLDAWGLVHALYHHSPVLMQSRPGWLVRPGHRLEDLAPAPYLPAVWQQAPEPLLDLVARARARTVRLFALDQLRAHHQAALQGVPVDRVRRFLSSPHQEVMAFGAELFEQAEGLAQLSVEEWKVLLRVRNPFAIRAIVAAFETHVSPTRLSDADLVELAVDPSAPVAALAARWLRDRPVKTRQDLELRLRLVEAPADTVRGEAARWLRELVAELPLSTSADARELLDARFADVRAQAILLVTDHPRFSGDVSLWASMSETPYDDVRAALLRHLDRAAGDLDADALQRVWASVLLAIHRGSRAKARAARQIAERMVREPSRAAELLPLLAVCLRSLRRPEQRSALGAVARAVFAHPALKPQVEAALPKLSLPDAEGPR